MKIIPVIDVLNGVAVHGIRGQRKQYQPLKSCLCNSTDPFEIAACFESLGFTTLYLADLDAILTNSINLNVIEQIVSTTNLDLMVDAGTSDLNRAEEIFSAKVSKLVVGSETLKNLDFVHQAISTFGENKLIVSVDQKEGKLLSKSKEISSLDVFSFVKKLEGIGITQIISLDLGRVGTEYGTDLSLIQKIIEKTELELLVGGGISSLTELEELRNIGVFGALVATVLHNEGISVDDLKTSGFL
ncbi:MAG: HisA/HisF-related TIM barrel protein [Candidatus Bathyarchaeota archaeon]|nr:HisA/HisF-related TIM barrel protein [Candidatus Bathyarchaeum tardum]